jgi:hypothetical protein
MVSMFELLLVSPLCEPTGLSDVVLRSPWSYRRPPWPRVWPVGPLAVPCANHTRVRPDLAHRLMAPRKKAPWGSYLGSRLAPCDTSTTRDRPPRCRCYPCRSEWAQPSIPALQEPVRFRHCCFVKRLPSHRPVGERSSRLGTQIDSQLGTLEQFPCSSSQPDGKPNPDYEDAARSRED